MRGQKLKLSDSAKVEVTAPKGGMELTRRETIAPKTKPIVVCGYCGRTSSIISTIHFPIFNTTSLTLIVLSMSDVMNALASAGIAKLPILRFSFLLGISLALNSSFSCASLSSSISTISVSPVLGLTALVVVILPVLGSTALIC